MSDTPVGAGFTFGGLAFPSLQEYIERSGATATLEADGTPRYAHPVDGWITRTLNATQVRKALNQAFDALVAAYLRNELANGVPIDRQSFPELYAALVHCARTLGIPVPYAVAQTSAGMVNAYATGTDESPFIVIAPAMVGQFTTNELRFVIGHECGHVASRHMLYHTLVRLFTRGVLNQIGAAMLLRLTAGMALLAWSRRSEVTCDRAGLLCCGDLAVAERALVRLLLPFADASRVDVDDYLRNVAHMHEYLSRHEHLGLGNIGELMRTHPEVPKRILALRAFANSELYYELAGKAPPPETRLLGREELDRRVEQVVQP